MSRIGVRITYANVVATIALFLALGGGAYAVTKVKKNSVTTKSIKNSTIQGKDVKNHTLTADDIDGAALAGSMGPVGPQGPPGKDGAQGPVGPSAARSASNDPNPDLLLSSSFGSQLDLITSGNQVVLTTPARIIATATVQVFSSNSGTSSLDATCRLLLRDGNGPLEVLGEPTTGQMAPGNQETIGNNGSEITIAITGGTDAAVPAGSYDIAVECLNNDAGTPNADVRYARGSMTAIAGGA